jgi:predicted TIM-barrel fold metal-dependent hydrolase
MLPRSTTNPGGLLVARTYTAISTDGHLELPPDDYRPFIAEIYQDRAPRKVETPEGGDSWLIEGSPLQHTASNLTAGQPITRRRSHWNADGSRFPGTGDGAQRLREQDQDGIDAEIMFPPIFASIGLAGISDARAYLAIIEGYNRFLGESYCPVARDRLIATGVIPERGIDGALAELERCKELGLKTVCLTAFPSGGLNPAPEDDRFWEAALALNMPVSAHIYFGAPYPPTVTGVPQPAAPMNALSMTSRQASLRPLWTISQLILTGVFDRFPELQLYFAETNASWLPIGLQQIDENYQMYEHLSPKKLAKLPSEYVRDHVYFTFIKDPPVKQMFDFLPVDNLMWGTDFPHSVTTFPNSHDWLDEAFEGQDPALRRKILVENPVKFFHLDEHAEITPTPELATAGA